jgi:diguanylate cyclase
MLTLIHAIENLNETSWERIAHTDQLSGIPNRRALDRHLSSLELQQATVSIAMIDFDFFKQINDSKGHSEGDRVLAAVAQSLQSAAVWLGDETAIAARFGGDEFVMLASIPAEQLGAIALDAVHHAGHQASIGVADGVASAALMIMADKAAFQAKVNGRDRVVVAG